MSFKQPFQHQDALFEAALAEFAAAGYEQASINTILTQAGMSKGQFYYHFKSKEGLYFALIERIIEQKQQFLAQVMQPADLEQDIFSLLETQIRHGLAFARAQPHLQGFLDSFLREKGGDIYDAALARFNFNDGSLNPLVFRAYARGELRSDVSLPFAQRIIGHLFTHAAELVDLSTTDEAETHLAQLIAFLKSGLAPKVEESP